MLSDEQLREMERLDSVRAKGLAISPRGHGGVYLEATGSDHGAELFGEDNNPHEDALWCALGEWLVGSDTFVPVAIADLLALRAVLAAAKAVDCGRNYSCGHCEAKYGTTMCHDTGLQQLHAAIREAEGRRGGVRP